MANRSASSLMTVFAALFLVAPSGSTLLAASASASVQVAVAQPQPVPAGANFDYVINVSNEGPDAAANVQLTFPLPAGTLFQATNAPVGWTCNSFAPGTMAPTVTCSIPTFPAVTAMFTITASTPPTASGTFSTTASVSSTTPDPSSNDNTFAVSVQVQPSTDLSAALSAAPDPVNAGSNLTWTMTVTNQGPSTATNATVDLPLPVQTTFVSLATSAGWSCTTPPVGSNGTVSCSLTGSMSSSASATFTLVSRVLSSTPSGTSISMTATVSSTSDSRPANDSATATVQSAPAVFDLGITKTRTPGPVLQGGSLQYTIAVTNAGPSDAPAVTMTDVLPAPLRFTSLTPSAGWSCTTPAAGTNGTVSCSNPSMAASSGASWTLNVTIDPATPNGTAINNTATVASTTPEASTANNTSTAGAAVSTPPNVTATKSIANGAQHPEGSLVTYTIVLSNAGGLAQADNPGNELTDVLPSSLTLLSAAATSGTAVANLGSNTVTWNGAIAGGGTVTISVQAFVKNGTSGSTISNSATVSYDSDGNGTNDATRSSDDPSTAAPNDATSFLVVGVVPALSEMMLLLLAAVLVAVSLMLMRK